jgi:hypothetical protein
MVDQRQPEISSRPEDDNRKVVTFPTKKQA